MTMAGGKALHRAATRALLLLSVTLASCTSGEEPVGARVGDFLGGDADPGYARATPDYRLQFPADHGSHPGFQSEWWYFTGNLESDSGRHFGFMFTVFRFALSPDPVARTSRWGTNQAWMAHFAITDTDGGTFFKTERFARGAAGLAGARAEPFAVWLHDWSARSRGTGEPFPMTLAAGEDGHGVALELVPAKPMVLQGERGYSRKGEDPGNASHYYAYTRLEARGDVTVAGRTHAVAGTAWMDREWGTSALGPGLAGWDWFALQLEDGRDLMFYQLRRDNGDRGPYSQGALVAADGTRQSIDPEDVRLTPEAWWRSPASGRRYPVAWRLRIPTQGLDLRIAARAEAQEMRLNVDYWEGAVTVTGAGGERGVGYLEMTGY